MSRIPAVLVMHADLAAAMLRAAEKVYGPVPDVPVLSNENRSREQLKAEIEAHVAGWTHGGVVLTDFWGGSCHQGGVAAARGHGEVVVLSGVNLTVLLDYLHNRDQYAVVELAERLLKKGQESVRLQRGQAA